MRPHFAACVFAAAALCGCGGKVALVGDAESAQAADLMNYFGRAVQLAAPEQKQELARARQACAHPAHSVACLRLGGLYAQPAAALRNDPRALELLARQTEAPGRADKEPRPLADLATLLLVQVEERIRLARSEEKKQEALRSSNEALHERVRAINALERENLEREDRARAARKRRK